MDSTTLIVGGIIFLFILILFTIFGLVIYSGLLDNIEVGVGEPPLQDFIGFYKVGTGSYNNASYVFSEACSIAPELKTFGIYYDDPNEVNSDKLRWIAGSVLSKDVAKSEKMELIQSAFEKQNFKKFEFPMVSSVVKTQFPFRSDLSVTIGAYRAYPKLYHFVKENRLKAFPYMEYYAENDIYYFAPLEKNKQFYVPDVDFLEKTAESS